MSDGASRRVAGPPPGPVAGANAVAWPPLSCRRVAKRFGTVLALAGVDLDVRPGSVHGFLGPNGAGKTTLLRIATGLLRANFGEVRIFGAPASDPRARARLGTMPADPAFYPGLSGRANLDLFAALHGGASPDRAWAAAQLGLSAADLEREVGGYSSGMRQKLGIVQAVQHRPDLVVLDEPANRLDPLAHRAFTRLVRETAATGRSVLLSSHALHEVEIVCDHVTMVHSGRILLDADAHELTARALRNVTVRYGTPPDLVPAGLVDPVLEGDVLRARLPPARLDVLRALLADERVEDVLVEPAGLEEVFLDLYADTR